MNGNPSILTIGEMTLDDVVIEDVLADWKQPGGGALYSSVGARLWTDSGICSVVGNDYPVTLLDQMAASGIDTSAVQVTDAYKSLGLWLLYESSGARHQIEKNAGGTFQQLDSVRPNIAALAQKPAGIHLAPQSSDGHAKALREIASDDVIVTLDLMVERFIDTAPYQNLSFFDRVDAFLPSAAEVLAVWGHSDILRLHNQLLSVGYKGFLLVKRGAAGVEISVEGHVVMVPAAPADVLDVTGAGDAFCGGFLAGLLLTGDPIQAAAHGVVSASFVVETRGAMSALAALDSERAKFRLDGVMKSIRKVR